MSWTLGQLCCATGFEVGDVVFQINLSDSAIGPTTVDVLALTGTPKFNNLRWGQGENLPTALAAWATAAELDAGTDGEWTAEARPGGTAGQLRLTRTVGDAADEVSSLTFPHADLPATFLGLTVNLSGNAEPTAQDSSEATWDTAWVGGLWLPPDPPVDDGGLRSVGAVAISASPFAGHALALDFGSVEAGQIVYELMLACWVFRRFVTADFVALTQGALEVGDDNATLEALIEWHRAHGPLRWWVDTEDLASWVNLEVVEEDALEDLRAELQNPNPALYRVEIPVRQWEDDA